MKVRKRKVKMRSKAYLLTLFTVFFGLNLSAQSIKISGKHIYELKKKTKISTPALLSKKYLFQYTPISLHPKLNISNKKKSNPYAYQSPKAFFCKIEHQLQKKIGSPIRFRLGEVEYQRRMEYGDKN